ncbi:Putative disease resistance protein RGA4 [Triticum urartu]|uniref:Putative disease resistance protein RGA4 n=1 Tax=Triticum urartu TaxID=4572 RepID=M7YL91_TRIUA|nr:Putative disease resistance protein RGA4 [Triticum urartu]
MAEVVATVVVGPLLKIVREKASGYLLDKYKVSKGMEEQHEVLMRKLPAILDIIADAEQAAGHREGVAAWLQAIKKVAYQANEVFDEFKYEALRREAKKERHYKELGFDVVKLTSRKQGYGPGRLSPLVPVQSRTGTNVGIGPVLGVSMAAAMAATMVVGPLVKIMMEKLSSELLNQYKVMKGMEKQHDILRRKLLLVLDIIADAEHAASDSEQAASCRAGAAAWLEDIKKVAYKANELFDEFKYEALRRKAKKEGHYNDLGFSMVKLFPSNNCFVFRKRMGRKLHRIVQEIEALMAEKNTFGFQNQQQQPVSNQWREMDGGIFDLEKITSRSREKDKKNIIDILVAQANNADLTVVPIVEMGGLGKTTLAQLVYNDPEIEKHFDVLLWVCASHNFDVDSLAKSIVDAAPKKMDDGTEDALKKKNDSTKAAAPKKKKTPLDILRNVVSGQREEDRPAVLVNMVGEIVKRCVGSPLAATALGSVLRTKTSEEEWKAVSIRSSICTEETGILPILKLSYNNLPSHMKQCFSFCAIFPKDYEIDVDKLIQLWIAHGFIIEEKQVRLETIGKHIFKELASMSFFQDVKQVQASTIKETVDSGLCYSRTTCKIHDLMHDVALSVMQKECALATEEPSQSDWLPNTARHLFLSCEEPEEKLNSSLANSSPAIQTLLCDGYMVRSLQHLSKYCSLQALQLCSYRRSFPLKPKHLHHLRYLDLSRSHIKALPDDFNIVYNLQTLNLSGCQLLRELPKHMKYMTALRHLYTHGCTRLKSMPVDLGELTSLQTLTCFVADSGSNCSSVGELGNLNLGGQLELRHLANVTKENAEAANLRNNEDDARVLARLKPHDGLHAIRIHSYGATTFPKWMAMLQNIVEIHLVGCIKLRWLFSRDSDSSLAFPNLKELTLDYLCCLDRWWEIDDDGMQRMFPQLEKLFITRCEMLRSLPGHPTFPNLQNARIGKCPQLTTTAKSPKLSVLKMDGRVAELFLWVARHMTSLTNMELTSLEVSTETTLAAAKHSLTEVLDAMKNWNDHVFPLEVLIRDCKSLVEVFNIPASLRRMQIFDCSKLESICGWRLQQGQSASPMHQGPSSILEVLSSSSPGSGAEHLEELRLIGCHGLRGVLCLPQSLKVLEIEHCGGLTSLECRSAGFPSLERLGLSYCESMSSLPDVPQAYSSLQHLRIFECPGMKTLPTSLQQRLGSLQWEYMDAHCYGSTPRPIPILLKPKTWKYVIRRD